MSKHSVYAKAVAGVIAGIAFVSAAGSASAAPSAGKQYKKIVAPFNKLVGGSDAPSVSDLKKVFSSTEKKLSSQHWPGKAGKDIKVLVTDMKKSEGFFEHYAKSSSYKPTATEARNVNSFMSQIVKVRKDLHLSASSNQGL